MIRWMPSDSLKTPEHGERQVTMHFTCSPLPPPPARLPVLQEEVERGLSLVLSPADSQCLGRWDRCPKPLRALTQPCASRRHCGTPSPLCLLQEAIAPLTHPKSTRHHQCSTEQRLSVYLAGPLRATGSHVKWPWTLYPTRHGATRVGTRPSRLQAPGLHDPGLHGPGFQHPRLQDPWLQASCLQGSRLHHPGLQPSRLQSSWLQPSGISSDCRGKTRQGVEGSSAAGSMGASALPPLPGD